MGTTISICLLLATAAITCATVLSGIAAYRMVAVSKKQADISAEQATITKHQRDIGLAQIFTSRLAIQISALSINYQLIGTHQQLELTAKMGGIDHSEYSAKINELNDRNKEVISDMNPLEDLLGELHPELEKLVSLVSAVVVDNNNAPASP